MEKLEELTTLIADELLVFPETARAEMALQIASSMVEMCGYEMARSGTVKSSTRLFLMANEIERLRRAEQYASRPAGEVVPFPSLMEHGRATA